MNRSISVQGGLIVKSSLPYHVLSVDEIKRILSEEELTDSKAKN
jgi:hypothetical protein